MTESKSAARPPGAKMRVWKSSFGQGFYAGLSRPVAGNPKTWVCRGNKYDVTEDVQRLITEAVEELAGWKPVKRQKP